MSDVRVVPTAPQYADSCNAAVDAVARERRYIGFVEGPPIASTREFLRRKLDGHYDDNVFMALLDIPADRA